MISVLFPCTYYDNYVSQLRNYLKKYYPDLRISILTGNGSKQEYLDTSDAFEDGERIYTYEDGGILKRGIYRAITELPKFDVIHCLWMDRYLGLYSSALKTKARAVYVSVGGSDLYRDAKRIWNRILQANLLKRAFFFSSENSQTRAYFNTIHGNNVASGRNHRIIRYGVDIIDAIRQSSSSKAEIKKRYGIPEDMIAVVCGHNARCEHQHEKMLDAIKNLEKNDIDRLFLIIPMTYGLHDEGYLAKIDEKASKITSNYTVLRDYMDIGQMAEMTMMTDIFIHVQTTDQLSSTMMASMYNGNIIIAGSWLPYDDIKEYGIRFWEVDDCNQITEKLHDMVENISEYYDDCKDNPDKVYRFSSWEYCSKDWYSAYEEALKICGDSE